MKIEESLIRFMNKVKSNVNNSQVIKSLGVLPDDKDCGYRAWLRKNKVKREFFLDEAANSVIYSECKNTAQELKPTDPQLDLFEVYNA